MKSKLFSFALVFSLVTGFAGMAVQSASADTYPAGCSSTIGTSVTTGAPCNGTTTATQLRAGCTSPIGYSTTTNLPCSGTGSAMQYLGGCSSIYGYSLSTGAPCNGTTVATMASGNPTFTAGCSSTIGTSITTGIPCNGGATATQLSAGCTSPIGYSTTNAGVVCSGTGTVMTYLGGCSNVYGYSTATGAPCNGTTVAVVDPSIGGGIYVPPTTPGLPTTAGSDSAPINIAIIIALAIATIAGLAYARKVSVNAR
jgi:hypothetical protein